MDQSEEPLFYDEFFHQKRKTGQWVVVAAPRFFTKVADTHAHIHMQPDPALALARAGAHQVAFISEIVDIAEQGKSPFEELDLWLDKASEYATHMGCVSCGQAQVQLPKIRFTVGCHPHNAKDYDDDLQSQLEACLHDIRVNAIGEIGLDYHYDLSPRDVQRDVFRRQIHLAHASGLPIALHVRDAHDDAFAILQQEGFPASGVLLHCYTLGTEEIRRWIDSGCYIAFGGALTFKKSDDIRAAARLVPKDRLLTETDSPFMTPEPLRGYRCEPAHIVFVAQKLAEEHGFLGREKCKPFLDQLYANAQTLLDRPPTSWQTGE